MFNLITHYKHNKDFKLLLTDIHQYIFSYLTRTLNETKDEFTQFFTVFALENFEYSLYYGDQKEKFKIGDILSQWRKSNI